MHSIILAGGSGTRFWPLSRKKYPKQLLHIIGDQSMLQMTVDRIHKCKKIEAVYISTRKDLVRLIKKEVKGIDTNHIIAESSPKNTAPSIGLAALYITKVNEAALMGVFPADHLIVGHRNFEKALNQAARIATRENGLVTIGIEPTFPSTAYGYIQYDQESQLNNMDAFPVKTFAEKPPLNTAKRFLKSGDFLWNTGMFVWRVDVFMEQLANHMPDLTGKLEKIAARIDARKLYNSIWAEIKPESIDYGLMEKVENIFVVKASFKWNDLGSWNAIYDELPKGKHGNLIKGNGTIVDGKGNFIYNNKHFTAVIGLDNIMVINTPDATLVVNKENVEDVKKAVNYLIENGYEDLL